MRICIKDTVRIGDDCGAQLILTEKSQIAKIYDPLYYAFYHADAPELKIDITAQADCDYAIEAAAYTEL
jgi:hypothetical protein